jgi:hypothetical protein
VHDHFLVLLEPLLDGVPANPDEPLRQPVLLRPGIAISQQLVKELGAEGVDDDLAACQRTEPARKRLQILGPLRGISKLNSPAGRWPKGPVPAVMVIVRMLRAPRPRPGSG